MNVVGFQWLLHLFGKRMHFNLPMHFIFELEESLYTLHYLLHLGGESLTITHAYINPLLLPPKTTFLGSSHPNKTWDNFPYCLLHAVHIHMLCLFMISFV